MAIIGNIRNRMGGLLVVVVGGALALFVISDLFSNRGGGGGNRTVGTIKGEDVDLQKFSNRVDNEVEAMRNDFGQTVDNNTQEQIRNQVWNDYVRKGVLKDQVEGAGFGTTLVKEEYDDVRFGDNIISDFSQNQQFLGPDGKPDKKKVKAQFDYVQNTSPTYYALWKERIIDNRLYAKYNALVKKSIFVNSAQAKEEFEQKNMKATFSFVVKPFNSEPDSLYTPTDDEIRRYYDAHKNEKKYHQKASRSFSFVQMPVAPTEEDKAAQRKEMETLSKDFKAATNDSLFVSANTDDRKYTLTPYTEGTADKLNDSLIIHADTGSVVGPYVDGENMKLVKIKALVDIPEVRVRHILFKADSAKADEYKTKRQLADSVLNVLKRDKSKFQAMLDKFTEDPGSKTNGGDYGWFDKDKGFVQEFKDAGFKNPTGWIGVVKTQFGFHIIEVLEKRTRSERRVCAISHRIQASPATSDAIWKKANTFALDHPDTASFRTGAAEAGLQVQPVDNMLIDQRYVPGIQDPKDIISWANNAEVGKVSEPKRIGDNYVVAILRSIKEDGPPALADVRDQFSKEVVKEKKAEAFVKQMTGKTDLNALATELKLTTQTASELPFSSYNLPGGYSENELIGRIFTLANGTTSAPLKGDMGVYVVQMTQLTPAPDVTDMASERKGLLDRQQPSVEGRLFNALKESGNVIDLRGKYF